MYDYDEFKENETMIEGIKTLVMDDSKLNSVYVPDVEYACYGDVSRKLQLIQPSKRENGADKYPTLVFVQGSAWFKQNVYNHVADFGYLAHRGYVVAIVEYRESTIAPFPAQVEDTKNAIRFLRKNADQYRVDANNIFVWGDSSGGHTALLTGLTGAADLQGELYLDYPSVVNGIIDFYGVVDITMTDGFPNTPNHQQPDSPEGVFLGRVNVLDNHELARKTLPMEYLDRDIPPILMIHGTKDRTVSFDHSIKLYQELKAKDKEVDFYRLRYADHGGPAFYQDEIFDIVIDFVRKHLK